MKSYHRFSKKLPYLISFLNDSDREGTFSLMTRPGWRSESARYTTIGAIFGLLFPVVAFLTITFVSRDIYLLFGVICTAPIFLGAFARLAGLRQDRLNETNRGLEQLVAERTSSIQSMLDLTGQGFLSFESDLIVNPEYSRECVRIFGGPIDGRRIDELLFPDRDDANEFVRGLSLCFAGSAKPEVIFDLLEHEFHLRGKSIRIDYRAVTNERVMLTLTDVTEEQRLQQRVRAEDERNERVLRAVKHKPDFGGFIRGAKELFDRMARPDGDAHTLSRELHTFKGSAGFFSFRSTQGVAHELEDHISESTILGAELSLDGKVDRLKAIFEEELDAVTATLGNDWIEQTDTVVVPKRDYLRIEQHVIGRYPADHPLIHTLESFRKRPLKELFARFPQMAVDLALQRGKQILPLAISGGEAPVVAERYERLVSSFTHILRNMVDHGIESPAEREQAGKPPEGALRIEIAESDEEIVFRFVDDGRGISLERVEERARSLGLISEDEHPPSAKLIDSIFHDGFSTASSVSLVSGRGVGLAEVRAAVREIKGKIGITTRAGRGTTFTITVAGRRPRSMNP